MALLRLYLFYRVLGTGDSLIMTFSLYYRQLSTIIALPIMEKGHEQDRKTLWKTVSQFVLFLSLYINKGEIC